MEEKEMIGNRARTVRIAPLLRPSWLPESVWPFQTFGLEVDGSVLAVTDVGQGQVVFIEGPGGVCPGQPGTYRASSPTASGLRLDVVQDPCQIRASDLLSGTWTAFPERVDSDSEA